MRFAYCTLQHCIKVLENRGDAASFWHLYRSRQDIFDATAKELDINLAPISEMSEKLKHIHDKTHFHIDREGLLDPKVVWRDADINGKVLADVVVWVWALVNAAQIQLGRNNLRLPDVSQERVIRATHVLEGKD